MRFAKKCPSCGEKLLLKIRAKEQCPNCDAWIQEDPKQSTLGSLALLFAVFITYPIDWRLSVVLGISIGIVLFLNTKYEVVDE
jgi:hypothetical protein